MLFLVQFFILIEGKEAFHKEKDRMLADDLD